MFLYEKHQWTGSKYSIPIHAIRSFLDYETLKIKRKKIYPLINKVD